MRSRGPSRRWWWPSLGIMAALWWLSSGADTPGPPLAHPWDWAAHFTAYLLLGYSLTRATGRPGLALVLAVWWGALDEVHQAFVPGREAGVQDWLFDLMGAWVGTRLAAPKREEGDPAAGQDAAAGQPGPVMMEFPN